MSKKWEFAIAVILALVGIGVSVGQNFEINGLVLFFWAVAVVVFVVAFTHKEPPPLRRVRPQESDTDAPPPKITVTDIPSTATINGRLLKSHAARVENKGGAFRLAARVRVIAVADGYECGGQAVFDPSRPVKGRDGVSDFTIAVVDQVATPDGTWFHVVKAIGEGASPYKRWEVRAGFWADFEWRFFHDKNQSLQLLETKVIRVSFSDVIGLEGG